MPSEVFGRTAPSDRFCSMATPLRPELLLLDEHTEPLIPKARDILVIALTEQVVVRDQLTTLMVTH